MKPPNPSTPLVLTALWLVLAVPIMTAALWAWADEQDRAAAASLQRDRVGLVEARAAELAADLAAITPAATAAEVEQLRAEVARMRAHLDELCWTLKVIGRQLARSERLPGADWCELRDVGSALVWRKHGWDVTDAEAAAIKARFAGPYTHGGHDPASTAPSDADGLRGAIYQAGGGGR